jgi:hypothetical protein
MPGLQIMKNAYPDRYRALSLLSGPDNGGDLLGAAFGGLFSNAVIGVIAVIGVELPHPEKDKLVRWWPSGSGRLRPDLMVGGFGPSRRCPRRSKMPVNFDGHLGRVKGTFGDFGGTLTLCVVARPRVGRRRNSQIELTTSPCKNESGMTATVWRVAKT